jgi:hydroxypyruvate reductase
LIKNRTHHYNKKTKDAIQILESGLKAAKPESFLYKFIGKDLIRVNKKLYRPSSFSHVYVIAIGKASDLMAKFCASKINIDSGIIVIPKNYAPIHASAKFRVFRSGHPIPDKTSVTTAKSIIKFLDNTKKEDLIIFLISGGASALVCLPVGITLKQKQSLTRELLGCGASIEQINALRKHLSQIKGGNMAKHLNCTAVSLVLSDVVGDDLSSIASGLTYCDKTTYSDCLGIIKKYDLYKKIPTNVLNYLNLGAKGKISETPKKPKIPNVIVANNHVCLDAMKKTARDLGYKTKVVAPVVGDVNEAAHRIIRNFRYRKKHCLVFGGEPTVKLRGSGSGGRNQELVLQILNRLKEKLIVASIGTDGIDGNTSCAGAIFHSAIKKSIIKSYLRNNDSHSFFVRFGGLIKTGPTHTNLLDIGVILKP